MTIRLAILALLLMIGGGTQAAQAGPAAAGPVTLGSAPVDAVFKEWLAAFNAGDKAAIKAFYGRRLGDPDAAFAIDNAADTCGFDPVRIESRTATAMRILLVERCFPALQRLTIELGSPMAGPLKTFTLKSFALTPDAVHAAVAGIADRLASRDELAGSLVIAQGDAQPWIRSWGTLDKAGRSPITPDTPMFLASAGKMFTAVAVLQLVDAGRIDLDAPIGRYLTGYPDAAMARVTVRQLLQHRGGTGDIGILARNEGANRARVRTIADILALNGRRAPEFAPGSKADYSNYGFVLLGAVVERVSGRSYYDQVAEHVFKPAGMRNAGFPDRNHLQGVATGYTTYFGEEPALRPNLESLPWRGTPAGGGVASANDMLAFFRALKGGRLLSAPMMKLATTAGDTGWYGMGFVVDLGRSWGHGGTSYGMDVAAHHYLANDTSFICLATRDMACNRLITAWHHRTFGAIE